MMRKKWIKSLIEKDLEPEEIEEEEKLTTKEPSSDIQYIIKEMYRRLKDEKLNRDILDKFYEEYVEESYEETEDGTRGDRYIGEFLDELGYPAYNKEQIIDALYEIGERLEQENQFLDTIYNTIEEKYPNLVLPPEINEDKYEKYQELGEDYAQKRAEELVEDLDKDDVDVEILEEAMNRIENVERTEIEEIASSLNNSIEIGRTVWEALIYASLSPYAPKTTVNGREIRKNIHALLGGDIATSKSQIMNILGKIAPHSKKVGKSTEAEMEGVASQEGIEDGIIDKANDGIMTVPEFEHIYNSYPYLRDAMDCDDLPIAKGGFEKNLDINISFIGGENPEGDFFSNDSKLRNQLDMRERILSRFDILIPLVTTTNKISDIIDQMDICGGEPLELEEFKQVLTDLKKGMWDENSMKPVFDRIRVGEEEKNRMKEVFKMRNETLDNGTPLLTLRAWETLIRLVNVVTATRFYEKDIEDGVIQVEEKDVDKAIEIWESLVNYRAKLYKEEDRRIESVEDKIMVELTKGSSETTTDLKKTIAQKEEICSERTVERKVNNLAQEGKLKKKGKRDPELEVKGEEGK